MKIIIKISVLIPVFFIFLNTMVFSQATISGRVYNDINSNGVYNAGEALNGVTVWLLNLNLGAPYYGVQPVQTTTTNSSGVYSFSSLSASNYQVRVMQSTIPTTLTRAVLDNDAYPNGLTTVMGVTGSNTYANRDFAFAATSTAPSFTSEKSFRWKSTGNNFNNTMSKVFTLPQETNNGNTYTPTVTWSTDRLITPGGAYAPYIYPQAGVASTVLGEIYPGNAKGGLRQTDTTFQIMCGGSAYTTTNNDRITITIQFNLPVKDAKFSIYDIDHADPQRASGRLDFVKVTGYYNNVPVMPVILNPSATPWNTVSGNTIYGFADYPLSSYTTPYNSGNEDKATVNVYFQNTFDKIIIEYEEYAPVMLVSKGIQDATVVTSATLESKWVNRTGADAPTTRGIGIGGIDYTIDKASIGLPVKLMDFRAALKNCATELSWKTAYEESLENFEIEFSSEGKEFNSIGKVTPENKINGTAYSYLVPEKFTTGYYRLKTNDIDGGFQYSKIMFINASCNDKIRWSLLTNPINKGKQSTVNLFIPGGQGNKAAINVWDIAGQMLIQQPVLLQPGQYNCVLKTDNLKAGMYFTGIFDDHNIQIGNIQKLIIQ